MSSRLAHLIAPGFSTGGAISGAFAAFAFDIFFLGAMLIVYPCLERARFPNWDKFLGELKRVLIVPGAAHPLILSILRGTGCPELDPGPFDPTAYALPCQRLPSR